MPRRTGFAELHGLRVGVWGIGVEGRASIRRIGSIAASLVLVDDSPSDSDVLATSRGGLDALLDCDVVLKSPGISRYRDDVAQLIAAGVDVTSALNLWMSEVDRTHVIAVTGTKGKSTTTSLISFLFQSLGIEAHCAGNFGDPPYDVDFAATGWTVLELSSFQSVELEYAPRFVVVTSLGADHLDWHGSLQQYRADKLAVTRASGEHVTITTPSVLQVAAPKSLAGEVVLVATSDDELARALGLLGAHNAVNVELAVHVVSLATGQSHATIRHLASEHASEFQPLPGRLTLVRSLNNRRYVDDGLATAPLPCIAALAVFVDDDVALIVGGHDRGVNYSELADAVAQRRAATTVIAMPDAGARIASAIVKKSAVPVIEVQSMSEAVHAARGALSNGGVVLLSPAAPSFGQYANWQERSNDFTNIVATLTS